jgi:hypothetical protein
MTRLFRARIKLREIMNPGADGDESGHEAQEELC